LHGNHIGEDSRYAASLPASRSARLEILDEVELLIRFKVESADPVVVSHYIGERRRAPVVKLWRVLPQCT